MKYSKGTVLKATPKGLGHSDSIGVNGRLIVIGKNIAIWFDQRNNRIIQCDFYKKFDSFVMDSGEVIPDCLDIPQYEIERISTKLRAEIESFVKLHIVSGGIQPLS